MPQTITSESVMKVQDMQGRVHGMRVLDTQTVCGEFSVEELENYKGRGPISCESCLERLAKGRGPSGVGNVEAAAPPDSTSPGPLPLVGGRGRPSSLFSRSVRNR